MLVLQSGKLVANTSRPWGRVYDCLLSHVHSHVCCGVPQLPYREDLREAEFATYSGIQIQEQNGAVDQLMSAMDMTSGKRASLAGVQVVCARKALSCVKAIMDMAWVHVQPTPFISL